MTATTPSKPKPRLPKSTPKNVTLTMTGIATACYLVAIWTGDERFAQTGIIPTVLGFISGFAWVMTIIVKHG